MHDVEADEVLGRGFDRRLVGRLVEAARPHARVILASGLLFPLIAGVELLQPYVLKVAIDDHILTGDWPGLTRVVGLLLATLLALYALRTLEDYLMYLSGQRVVHDLRARIFSHLLRLEAAFFDRNPVGRLMTRVLHDVDAVGEAFTSGLFAVIGDIVVLAGVVGMMLWLDWRLALVTFSLMPVLVTVIAWFRVRARDAYREVRRRLSRMSGYLQESIAGMSVTQLFGRERHEAEGFRRLNADYRQALFRSTVWEASLYATVEGLGSIALALLLWYGARARSRPRRSRSARWSRSSSTPTASSCPSAISGPSTRSCRGRWPRRSASSACSTARRPSSRRLCRRRRGRARPRPSPSTRCGSRTTAKPGCCATAASRCARASAWRSWAPPARARRPARAC